MYTGVWIFSYDYYWMDYIYYLRIHSMGQVRKLRTFMLLVNLRINYIAYLLILISSYTYLYYYNIIFLFGQLATGLAVNFACALWWNFVHFPMLITNLKFVFYVCP